MYITFSVYVQQPGVKVRIRVRVRVRVRIRVRVTVRVRYVKINSSTV